MLEFLVIVLLITVAAGAVQLRKQGQTLAKLTESGAASEPDALIVALGQIPEGNYQAFIANPEVFAKAHAVGQRVALMENHLTKSLQDTLKAAEHFRSEEYRLLKQGMPIGADRVSKQANNFEKRAQEMAKGNYMAAPELPATER